MKETLDENTWNPIFTAFAFRKHFNHLALLQIQGRKEEAKTYLNKLYLGIVISAVFLVIVILVLKII